MTPEQLIETPDLIVVGVAGDEIRRRKHGSRTTFNRVFEIHVDAPPQALPARVSAGEFRVVGKPPSLEVLITAVKAAATLAAGSGTSTAPSTPVTVCSLFDLLSLPDSIRQVSAMLKDAGASAIVQLSLDLVENPEIVLQDVREAGLDVLTLVIEDLEDSRRIELCRRAASLQAAVGGFRAFAPLARRMSVTKPTTGYDDIKTVSLARVVADSIESIQVDWALYGPKLAQVVLTVGADDVDNVAAMDPGILGTRRSPLEEIKGNIKAAALEAIERDALFRVNPKIQTPNSQGVS